MRAGELRVTVTESDIGTGSGWLENAKRRGFPRLFGGSGSRRYAQVALVLYDVLEGPGPETLHVLPLTVSVMQ